MYCVGYVCRIMSSIKDERWSGKEKKKSSCEKPERKQIFILHSEQQQWICVASIQLQSITQQCRIPNTTSGTSPILPRNPWSSVSFIFPGNSVGSDYPAAAPTDRENKAGFRLRCSRSSTQELHYGPWMVTYACGMIVHGPTYCLLVRILGDFDYYLV